jgi:hypothetical protein
MIPIELAEGIMLYGIIQVIVAFIAVILAIKWKKNELLAGLLFLFIYTLVSVMDVYIFTIKQSVFLDIAQFGFILLALISFIIGMNPAWAHKNVPGTKQTGDSKKTLGTPGVLCYLKKF